MLAALTDEQDRVTIPGFCEPPVVSLTQSRLREYLHIDDNVRSLSDEEQQSYTVLAGITQTPALSLAARWRNPSLTIHNVEVSGPKSRSRSRYRIQ